MAANISRCSIGVALLGSCCAARAYKKVGVHQVHQQENGKWAPTSYKWNDFSLTHRIHVWYIYLHLVDFYAFHVGKYTSPMDPMGYKWPFSMGNWLLQTLLIGDMIFLRLYLGGAKLVRGFIIPFILSTIRINLLDV